MRRYVRIGVGLLLGLLCCPVAPLLAEPPPLPPIQQVDDLDGDGLRDFGIGGSGPSTDSVFPLEVDVIASDPASGAQLGCSREDGADSLAFDPVGCLTSLSESTPEFEAGVCYSYDLCNRGALVTTGSYWDLRFQIYNSDGALIPDRPFVPSASWSISIVRQSPWSDPFGIHNSAATAQVRTRPDGLCQYRITSDIGRLIVTPWLDPSVEHVVSGADGTLIRRNTATPVEREPPGRALESALALTHVGDVNGDGVPDYTAHAIAGLVAGLGNSRWTRYGTIPIGALGIYAALAGLWVFVRLHRQAGKADLKDEMRLLGFPFPMRFRLKVWRPVAEELREGYLEARPWGLQPDERLWLHVWTSAHVALQILLCFRALAIALVLALVPGWRRS